MGAMEQMMAQLSGGGAHAPSSAAPDVQEDGPHKTWTSVYPIYVDAKQRYRKGCRRVAYTKAAAYPTSQLLADAVRTLRLECVHEPHRTHPRDWANPGRVKVRLHTDAKTPVRADLATKQQLLEALAAVVQPRAGGVPPPLPRASKNPLRARERTIRRVPIEERFPPHSPAVPAGMLGMNFANMPGTSDALKSMGPLGSMMSSMGLGGDDDDEPDEEKPAARAPAPGRRQRKRVVRIGR